MVSQDMKTLGGIVFPTYKAVCKELGILQDDGDWRLTLEEAEQHMMCPTQRVLFATMLICGSPIDPPGLFEDFWKGMASDYSRHHEGIDDSLLRLMVLTDIEKLLHYREKELVDFGLPTPTFAEREELARVLEVVQEAHLPFIIQQSLDFDVEAVSDSTSARISQMNSGQQEIFKMAMEQQESGRSFLLLHLCQTFCLLQIIQKNTEDYWVNFAENPTPIFIDARGGTGKTFLLNAIIGAVRIKGGEKNVVVATAYSGIASSLLDNGGFVLSLSMLSIFAWFN